MYYNVTVYNSACNCLVNYDVTPTENVRKWCKAPAGYVIFDAEKKEYVPTCSTTEFVIRKTTPKPSIYKRGFMQCRKDRYDYAFTEKVTRTTTSERDVYYNAQKDKFLRTNTRTTSRVKTEYDLPHLICF